MLRLDRLITNQIEGRRASVQGTDSVLRSAMFSPRLERRRQFNRLAVLVAATLLVVGIALIAVWAVLAFDMLKAAEADRTPIITGVLIALAVLLVLCLIAYAAIRAVGASHRVDGKRQRHPFSSPPPELLLDAELPS